MSQRYFTQSFACVGAILEKDGKILLVKEAGGRDKGKWNQPAGWIDVGHNPLDMVIQEVREEAGLIFEPTHLLGIYSLARKDHEGPNGNLPHALKLIYTGEFQETGETPSVEEILELRWFLPEEIYSMNSEILRDMDIKKEVKDYFNGKRYPLEIVSHTVAV